MSTATQIRTLQKAWDMMAERIVKMEENNQALWDMYGKTKQRLLYAEERIKTLEHKQ